MGHLINNNKEMWRVQLLEMLMGDPLEKKKQRWRQYIITNIITNRIYNKILDRDWFSVRLFVT